MPWDVDGNELGSGLRRPTGQPQLAPGEAERYERARRLLGLGVAALVLGVAGWFVVDSLLDGRFSPEPAWPYAEPDLNDDLADTTIVFNIGCGREVQLVSLEETATEVRVRLEGKGKNENDCQDFFHVELANELGDREIVDLVSGRRFQRSPETPWGFAEIAE